MQMGFYRSHISFYIDISHLDNNSTIYIDYIIYISGVDTNSIFSMLRPADIKRNPLRRKHMMTKEVLLNKQRMLDKQRQMEKQVMMDKQKTMEEDMRRKELLMQKQKMAEQQKQQQINDMERKKVNWIFGKKWQFLTFF